MRLDVRNSASVASDSHDLATGGAIPIGLKVQNSSRRWSYLARIDKEHGKMVGVELSVLVVVVVMSPLAQCKSDDDDDVLGSVATPSGHAVRGPRSLAVAYRRCTADTVRSFLARYASTGRIHQGKDARTVSRKTAFALSHRRGLEF